MRNLMDRISLYVIKARLAFSGDERGQDLAEYGLIIALIAIVAIAALKLLGENIASVLSNIAGAI